MDLAFDRAVLMQKKRARGVQEACKKPARGVQEACKSRARGVQEACKRRVRGVYEVRKRRVVDLALGRPVLRQYGRVVTRHVCLGCENAVAVHAFDRADGIEV